jgi:dienelactone hydrolase
MFFTIAEGARPKDVASKGDFRVAVALYPACQPFLAREPKWAPRQSLLFLMGAADDFTLPGPCEELLGRAAPSSGVTIDSHFYPGAYHNFDHPGLPIRVLSQLKLPPDGRSPTIGTNQEAQSDAIGKGKQFLASNLK